MPPKSPPSVPQISPPSVPQLIRINQVDGAASLVHIMAITSLTIGVQSPKGRVIGNHQGYGSLVGNPTPQVMIILHSSLHCCKYVICITNQGFLLQDLSSHHLYMSYVPTYSLFAALQWHQHGTYSFFQPY